MPRPPQYVTRVDLGWGPTAARSATPRSGLVVHYDSVDQNLAGKSHSACLTYWNQTRAFHMGPSRGWADVGYSFMACAHGYVLEGRGLYREQAAQPGGNTSHYSVTLATGPRDRITDEQINAVRALRLWLVDDHQVDGKVLGHRDFIATSCPGNTAYGLVTDGTFTKHPGEMGVTDVIYGLKKGDTGERVRILQIMIRAAGFGDALLYPGGPADGIDEDYGNGVAEGVRLCREFVGSQALAGWGDKITPDAYVQMHRAVARREALKMIDREVPDGSGSGGGELPATESVTVTGKLTVKR